jgi:hypothetical protein
MEDMLQNDQLNLNTDETSSAITKAMEGMNPNELTKIHRVMYDQKKGIDALVSIMKESVHGVNVMNEGMSRIESVRVKNSDAVSPFY